VVVLYRVFGAVLILGAIAWFVLFVVRWPARWVSGYGERLMQPLPKLSKENMNRGQFMIHFYTWIARSRSRAAVWCVFMAWVGWRMWNGQLLVP
jgi:hypothetical protein